MIISINFSYIKEYSFIKKGNHMKSSIQVIFKI